MIGKANIVIDRSAETVFDFITDPKRAAYWNAEVQSFQQVTRTDTGIGNQYQWIFEGNGFEVEAIETVVAIERPTLFASKHILTQFLSGPPPEPGERPMTRDDLDHQFRLAYGKGEPGGLVAVTIDPLSEHSCDLAMSVDTQMGGTSIVFLWIRRLFRRSALPEKVQSLKQLIEAEP